MLYYDILIAEDCKGRYMWKVLEDADVYTSPKIMAEGNESTVDEAYKAAKVILQDFVAKRESDPSEVINLGEKE